MSKDLDREKVLEYLKKHPELISGAMRQIPIRMYPHEVERLKRIKGKRSYREILNVMMDLYEEKAGE